MEKKNIKLSVALATYNEEGNLSRCLDSVRAIADEIIVVDGGSTDATVAIAKKYGAKVVETNNPPIFHINKQKALDACSGVWILQLDADEVVSQGLSQEIQAFLALSHQEIESKYRQVQQPLFMRHQALIEARDGVFGSNTGEIVAFFLARQNYFLGRPMRYAGMYPDGVIRLVKRGFAVFPAQSVHEQILINGRVSWLHHDLYHYSNETLHKYVLGASRYTRLLAMELSRSPKGIVRIFFDYCLYKPLSTFFSLYIRHKGILDGVHGFLFALFSSFHFPVAFYKYVQISRQ